MTNAEAAEKMCDAAKIKAKKMFSAVPNRRDAECCGTCVYWEWDYEREGDCSKFSNVVADGIEFSRLIIGEDLIDSTDICDLWTARF